jgi:hypothetical protein
LLGLTKEEYESEIKNRMDCYTYKYTNYYSNRIVARAPKSDELLQKLGIDNNQYDIFMNAYNYYVALNKLNEQLWKLVSKSYSTIFESKYSFNSEKQYSEYASVVTIIMCRKTGYYYLVTINREFIVPVFRIESFEAAMLLRKQLLSEQEDIRTHPGIMSNTCWDQHVETSVTMYLQENNISNVSEYPEKYRHLTSYVPEKRLYENVKSISDSNKSIDTIEGFNEAYLSQYLQTDAMALVASIPAEYKYNNTYRLPGVAYTATEYINKNNLYAYKLSNGMNIMSECSFKELFRN